MKKTTEKKVCEKKSKKTNKLKKRINMNANFTVIAILLIIIFAVCITPVTFQNDTYYTIKI